MRDVLVCYGFVKEWSDRNVEASLGAWPTRVELAVHESAYANSKGSLAGSTKLELLRGVSPEISFGGPRPALDDWSNIEGTRLLTKCRLNHLMLLDNIGAMLKWPDRAMDCILCGGGRETMRHYLLVCPVLAVCRSRLGLELRAFTSTGLCTGTKIWQRWCGGPDERLRLMLGGSLERSPTDDAELAGQVLWNIDKAIKCFMVSMWRMRTCLTGVLSVKQG